MLTQAVRAARGDARPTTAATEADGFDIGPRGYRCAEDGRTAGRDEDAPNEIPEPRPREIKENGHSLKVSRPANTGDAGR